MENQCTSLQVILSHFDEIAKKPEDFVRSSESFTDRTKELVKQMYDFTKTEELKFNTHKTDALPELIVQNFDLEQIWQQLELQNDSLLNTFTTQAGKFVAIKNKLLFDILENEKIVSNNKEVDSAENSISNNESNIESDNSASHNSEDEVEEIAKKKSSAVDDEFFNLKEMNNFLITAEKELDKKKPIGDDDSESEGSVNMFAEGSDLEDSTENDKLKNPRFKDFFKMKQRHVSWQDKLVENNVEVDNSDGDNFEKEDEQFEEDGEENEDLQNDHKSSLELREERLRAKIKEIESTAVSEKPWQLKGEITAESRPQNSLLEEVLEFDLISRPAPVITEETTCILEDVIKQRIKDRAYDDVERKQKPTETPLEYKKKLMLDQEKSKESLAQIYENEFIKQRDLSDPNSTEEEAEPPTHQEIKTLMKDLFNKLDALSNFHYTPKPAVPELKIISNLPAISIEEVAPVTTSNAALLAPQEVKKKSKGDIIGKSERTNTDKKRERRRKKLKQKIHAKAKQNRDSNKISGVVNNKKSDKGKKATKNLEKRSNEFEEKSIKSSTAFFTKLQEEAQSHIKIKRKTTSNKNKTFNAKKIKL